jgi:hypothetical protein
MKAQAGALLQVVSRFHLGAAPAAAPAPDRLAPVPIRYTAVPAMP